MTQMSQTQIAEVDRTWWREKIHGIGLKSFNINVADWAVHIFDRLCDNPTLVFSANDLTELSGILSVPGKYVSRAIAALTRSGTVTADLTGPVAITLHPDRLARRKNSAQKTRGGISPTLRAKLMVADDYRCGECGEQFQQEELEIDHIIPVSLLGADEPANWVAMCKAHNRQKWDRFERDRLRHYRGEAVTRPIQVRFRKGFFWPVINGKLRTATRKG